ncbi:MAG: bifunctional alpha,alpha-trehalose-phosphate synthase (UDP-forming)/trehalose-phosphatase [Candidatus Micrarchaeaceae archaeon]
MSNRLPLSFAKDKEGNIVAHKGAGGLATGVQSYLNSSGIDNYVWVGWAGSTFSKEDEGKVRAIAKESRSIPVFIDEATNSGFYKGFCNRTLYPLFHYFTGYVDYDDKNWVIYRKVNEMFCDAVLSIAEPGDIIWIHDYHLMLLPAMVKSKMPEAMIGFFLHIPFPSYEIFRLLPREWSRGILAGTLGADLIGFHTYDYMQDFLTSASRLLGYESNLGYIEGPDSLLKRVDTFPMGIDFSYFQNAAKSEAVAREKSRLSETLGDAKLIFSIDRLDYTKGILNRLRGYELFLEKNPGMRGKVRLFLVVVPSREDIPEYGELKVAIDEKVGAINGKFGTVNWVPIIYQYKFIESEMLVALFGIADVALITPLRDGMNLVAKEYIASKTDYSGVLVLSDMAGAAKELGEAVIVNPNHPKDISSAIEAALLMGRQEQAQRIRAMQDRIRSYDIIKWGNDFIKELNGLKEMQEIFNAKLLGKHEKDIVSEYANAKRALFLLDYDGTLVDFSDTPEGASPPKQVIDILSRLSGNQKNSVVIISGRGKGILDKWFSGVSISLVAEHGVLIRERGSDWRYLRPLTTEWKPMIIPIMKDYANRLPGSYVEEKEFSVVWHYRKAESEFASLRVAELFDSLSKLTANADVQVYKGNKIIEVKNSGVNKGTAASYFISKESPDFILALGDDYTDEDMFRLIPKEAYSVRVGVAQSYARFNLHNAKEAISLLEKLLGTGK